MARHKSLVGTLINPVSAGPITRHIPGAHAVRMVTSGAPRVKVSGIKAPKPPKAKVSKLMTGTHQGQKKAVVKNPNRRPLPPPTQKAQQPNQTQQALKVLRTVGKLPVKPPRVRVINRLSPGHFAIGRGLHRRK